MRRAGLLSIAVTAVCALCACGSRPPAYSGTVQTESVAVGSEAGGRVLAGNVSAGSVVHRGDIVVRLDPSTLQAQYAQADAQEREASARLAEVLHGNVPTDVTRAREQAAQAAAQYRQTVAQSDPQASAQAAAVRDALAALVYAKRQYLRMSSLASTGDVAQQDADNARSQYRQALARVAQARANYAALVNAQLPGQREGARANELAQFAAYQTVRNGTRPEEIAQARAQLAAARAARERAEVQLRESVVRSPVDGVVASFNLHPGDLLAPNQQAAIIDTFAQPYAYIYASQRDLGRLRNGTHLHVVSDADGESYDGVVETHDRTAQFTPQNTETADQRAELVYGVKIRIHDESHRLLAGTTVTVNAP